MPVPLVILHLKITSNLPTKTKIGKNMFSLLLNLIACTEESPWFPRNTDFSESSAENNGEPSDDIIDVDFEIGDPISFTATYPQTSGGGGPGIMYEWMDAAIYDSQYAILTGVSGIGVVARSDGEILYEAPNVNRTYRVDTDGETIIVGSRTDRVSFWQMPSPPELSLVYQIQPDGTHEDVAVDDGVVAITWRDQGLKLYQSDGTLLTTVSAEDAFAVDIFEDRLVYSDKEELVLLDISTPSSPQELHRIDLIAEGRDIAWNGTHIAVGMGGNGVATFTVTDDTIAEHDDFLFDGTALSLAIDGEYLWTATWNSVWLSWIGDTQVVHLGQETPEFSAMGLDAEGGQAIIADWYQSTVLTQNEGLWGPEVTLPVEQFFSNDFGDTQVIPVPNYSSQSLTVNFTAPPDFSLNETSFTVDAGKTEYLRVTSSSSPWHQMALEWTSNDPDEASGMVLLKTADSGVGSAHANFDLPIITADDGLIGNGRLSDYQGKVLFLAWWSDY